MKIRGLDGKLYTILEKELYIKPFYVNNVLDKYCICHNVGNNEVVVAQYKYCTVAKYMLKLLRRYSFINIQDQECACFPENKLLKEMGDRIEKVTYENKMKEDVQND